MFNTRLPRPADGCRFEVGTPYDLVATTATSPGAEGGPTMIRPLWTAAILGLFLGPGLHAADDLRVFPAAATLDGP